MKKIALALALSASIGMSAAAYAQDAFIATQGGTQYLAADELIGAKVYGQDNKIIGDIEDVILSEDNVVEGVIMGTGGFLGIAEKKVGVKLNALQDTVVDGKTVVALPGVTNETLKSVPEFKRAKPKKSLLQRAKEKALELGDKTTATSKDAYEKAKPTIDQAKKAAGEAFEKAKDAASKAKEAATQAIEKATDAAKSEPEPSTEPAPNTQPAQ